MKVVITGAAGLVGQNLIQRLKQRSEKYNIVALDKHAANIRILRRLHPELRIIETDLAESGPWQIELDQADCVVMAHAQIGGLVEDEFVRNNITATEKLLAALASNLDCRVVHISSSVVNSAAVDWYTETKKAQEKLVLRAGHPTVVLRPTLMFGPFDRKHLGWLARFMKKAPIFPVPGHGGYLRQPLYVGDFCAIIEACMAEKVAERAYNISGQERVPFIDLMRMVRSATGARALVVRVPLGLFWWLLRIYAVLDKNPPFTTKQLEALVTPDEFDVIDWPGIFHVPVTPLDIAIKQTFQDSEISSIVLEF
jgi:nucleoside-diphosphate-sugar epimerase